jgi:hypothetical protein
MVDRMKQPTPWTFNKWEDVIDAIGEKILVRGMSLTCSDQAIANSAYIIRCVNSHDELVSLLQDWVNSFADTMEGGESDELVQATREALKKATE